MDKVLVADVVVLASIRNPMVIKINALAVIGNPTIADKMHI
jgi:hypothetical protein